MPRIRVPKAATPGNEVQLRRELVDELRSDRQVGQPLIIESPLEDSKSIKVHVIWDKWQGIDHHQRSVIIQSAYDEVEGEDYVRGIAMEVGLTFDEAIVEGLLPYEVKPLRRDSDSVSLEECQQAMRQCGATQSISSNDLLLAFPTAEQARGCIDRLEEVLPASRGIWSVVVHAAATNSLNFN